MSRTAAWLATFGIVVLLPACWQQAVLDDNIAPGDGTDTSTSSESSTDTDSDTDADSDTDSDSDSDSDLDSDTGTCSNGTFEGTIWPFGTDDFETKGAGYTATTGNVIMMNSDYQDFAGLECLETVGLGVLVYQNKHLTSLQGLNALTTVASTLRIAHNNHSYLVELNSLDELGSLISVGGDLVINNNDSLPNLDGLSSLVEVGGEVRIGGNAILPDCEACELLAQITNEPTQIVIYSNLDDACTPAPENCP
jgi:hypothetical protein